MVFHQLSFSKKRFDPHHERGKKNPLTFATAILSLSLSSENTKALRVVLSSFQSAYKVVKVAKLHTKWCSSFFLFRGVERRVKNTRTNKKSFYWKKKRSQSSSLKLFLIKSLCLFVSLSLSRVRVREKERVGWSRYVEGISVALCFIAAFRGISLGFESVWKSSLDSFPLLFFSLSLDWLPDSTERKTDERV